MVTDLVKEYCRILERSARKSSTVSSYKQDLESLRRWAEGTLGEGGLLLDLTPIDLKQFRLYLMDRFKPSTVNKALVVIKAFFRWLQEKGYTSYNPAAELKSVPSQRPAPRWLDKKEQLRLLRQLQKENNKRDMAAVSLMLRAGLRCSEVCNLGKEDIELSERKGKVIVRYGKGEKWREVPLNSDTRKALAAYLEDRVKKDTPYLFSTRRSAKMTPRGLQHMVGKYAQKAGLEKLSPHILRHTFCHELLKSGSVPLDVVATLAGHITADGRPNLRTTVIYTTPSVQELQEAVERLNWE